MYVCMYVCMYIYMYVCIPKHFKGNCATESFRLIYSNIGLSFRATVPLSIRYTVPYHTMELLNDNRHNFFCKTISNEHTLMTAACYFFCRERGGEGREGGTYSV